MLTRVIMLFLEWWPPGNIKEDKQEIKVVLDKKF